MKTAIKRNLEIGPKDQELIRQIARSEPCFTTHPAHEARAYELARLGYLSKEPAAYASTVKRIEYRWRYSLTERGRRELS